MGFFDLAKKKDSDPLKVTPPLAPQNSLPVDQVITMKQQGISDNQIIQNLQRDGYKSHQIFDAMNQADLTSGAPRQLDDMPPSGQQDNTSQFDQSFKEMPGFQAQQQPPAGPPQFGQQARFQQQYPQFPQPEAQPPGYPAPQQSDQTTDRIEEIAESIIEEKWADLTRGVSKITEWKERTDLRINELEMRMNELRKCFDELNKNVVGKLSDYDKNITSVGTDIKAMEKVFQQMLPTFTENVNELSRITKNIKSKGPGSA